MVGGCVRMSMNIHTTILVMCEGECERVCA